MRLADLVERNLSGAYALARSAVDDPADAEDAVNAAVASILSGAGRYDPARPFFPYFARAVLNAARTRRRTEARRAVREEAVMPKASGPSGLERLERAEEAAATRAALAALESEERTAVLLAHMEGLSTTDVAGILGVPRTTAADRVRRGVEKLRAALVRAGFGAMALSGLVAAQTRAPVPARLAGAVRSLVKSKAAAGAGTAATAAKGGIAMKFVAGLVLAGAVAGVAAVSMSGQGDSLPAEKPKKFAIPVWHPDAEWKVDKRAWAGVSESIAPGVLDGPRQEIMWRRTMNAGLFAGMTTGCRYVALSYEQRNERYYTSAGGARGYLDGPFGRARFGGIDYSHRARFAASPDGRYVYFSEPYQKFVVRVMDFEKQEVRTFWKPEGYMKGPIVADSAGRLYVVRRSGKLYVFNPDGKVEKELALDMQETFGGLSASIALDEKRGRDYGAGYGMKKWYVFYWDVKDGSFHGVLPIPQKGEPSRGKPKPGAGLPGPFKGTALYGEGDVAFGPDDPDKNFLYTGRVDTRIFFRLDLKKQFISHCSRAKDGTVKFISEGKPGSGTGYGRTPRAWLPDGSFLHAAQSRGGGLALYRRVK